MEEGENVYLDRMGRDHEMAKLTGKRGKIYKRLVAEGKTEAYARRISKGLAEGKRLAVARGHKEERYRKPPKAYQPAPRGRLEKKKEEWAAYAYQDFLAANDNMNSPFSMSSYDHTKTEFKNYNPDHLFEMHQFMERNVQNYFQWYFEPAAKENIYVDTREDQKYQHRQFEWKMFDEEGELRYWLVYENGEIRKRQMWSSFDFFEFKIYIREIGVWK